MRIEESIVINRPHEEVFAFFDQRTNDSRWMASVVDPSVAEVFLDNAVDVLGDTDEPELVWDDVLAAEPRPWLTLEGESIDSALAAMGAFADLASPYLSGHSAAVGNIAHDAAGLVGFDRDEAVTLRRAGYVLDLGKVSVHPRIWANPGRLSGAEWEEVRLHPYQTERILARAPLLASLGDIGRHASRETQRLRIPPGDCRCPSDQGLPTARGCRCLPIEDRATSIPNGPLTRRGGCGNSRQSG